MRPFSALSLVLALGACAFGQYSSHLAIQVSHSGHFLQGQTNAFHLIRVSNPGHAWSHGWVVVTDHAQSGLKTTALHGQGWSCSNAACWRHDALPPGHAYPAIMTVATVDGNAPSQITYTATVTRDQDWNGRASDVTTIDRHGYPIAWGYNYYGESSVPAGLTNGVAVAGGPTHSLLLKSDGTVAAWGDDSAGQIDVPAGLTNVVAIATGFYHDLALRSDGTVVAWGDDSAGQTDVPAGLTNVVAVSAGFWHSLALKSDGTVAAWGYDGDGETDVPAGLTNVVAIATGFYHDLALKSDGTVVAWGDDTYGQTNVPAGLKSVAAVAAGETFSLALKSDGTVAGWGTDWYGETDVPAGLANVVAVSAGDVHSLALKSDGTVVAWGYNDDGETEVPAGLTNVVAIAAGAWHNLVLSSSASSTIATTIRSDPYGTVEVDGKTYYCCVLFDWAKGSSHTIATTTPQFRNISGWGLTGHGWKYSFTGWSDGGAISHTIHANTAGKIYTANFATQYGVMTAVSPAGSGTADPPMAWYDLYAVATVTATPNPGYTFTYWSGLGGPQCGSANPCHLTILGSPRILIANFTPGP